MSRTNVPSAGGCADDDVGQSRERLLPGSDYCESAVPLVLNDAERARSPALVHLPRRVNGAADIGSAVDQDGGDVGDAFHALQERRVAEAVV